MKKFAAFVMVLCLLGSALPVSAATHDDHKKKQHKVHTKSHHMKTKAHKMHTKALNKAHIKAMPKTGMGGASEME
ncbi:hypothetical protein [Brevibacillus sp. SIMBA_040]|uniref:hypothetical protein n=1 Tax=unclassified Brevibacillus TaxID=2684853 RepID=UPI00397BA424